MTIIAVPLDQLEISEHNVRRNQEDANRVNAIAASIKSRGLLQPPLVHDIPGKPGRYGVLGGGRRFRAMRLLVDRGDWASDRVIDVIHRPFDIAEITAASAAENLKVELRPYEVYLSYKVMFDNGMSVAEIAEGFDQRPIVVEQYLRLGNLHPDIFAELEAGRITDATARAYAATEDHDLQLMIFRRMQESPPHQHNERAVRAALKVADQDADRLMLFVGRRVYEAAGGGFERDLFQEADHEIGRVVHPEILARLKAARLEQLRKRITAAVPRAFKFVDKPPQTGAGFDDRELRLEVRRAPLSEEDQRKRAALTLDIDRMSAELAAIDQETPHTVADLERREEIIALIDEADAAIELLDDSRRFQLPRKGDLVAVLKVGVDGNPDLSFWYASRKAKKDAKAEQAAPPPMREGVALNDSASPGQAQVANRRVADEHGLTKDGIEIFRSLRRLLLRAALITSKAEGDVATDYVIWSQLRGKIYDGDGADVGAWLISPEWSDNNDMLAEPYLADQPAKQLWDEAIRKLKAQTFITSPNPGAAFIDYQHASADMKRLAAGILAGLSVKRSINADGYRLDIHDVLANCTKQSSHATIRTWWIPTAKFLDLIPKAKRADIADGMVDPKTLSSLVKLKANEITDRVARVLIGRSPDLKQGGVSKAAAWVHPVLQFARPKVSDAASADKQEAA